MIMKKKLRTLRAECPLESNDLVRQVSQRFIALSERKISMNHAHRILTASLVLIAIFVMSNCARTNKPPADGTHPYLSRTR